MKSSFIRNKFSRTVIPLILIQSGVAKNDYKVDVRKNEMEILKKQILNNKKLYILSGPKHVGKSFLTKQFVDNNVIIVDLRAKSSQSSVLWEIWKQLSKNVDNIKADFKEGTLEAITINNEKKVNEVTLDFEVINQIITSVLKDKPIKPSCLIIDEAQTLRYIEKSNLTKLIELFIAITRDHNVSIVFVTSDYSSLIAAVGISLLPTIILTFDF